MKRLTFLMLLVACTLNLCASPRIVINLDFNWRFHAGKVPNGEKAVLNDDSWKMLNLPHDFQIEQEWVAPTADEKADNSDAAANIKSRLSSRGFKEMGQAWYRLHFTPADSLKGKRLLLQFDGIMYTGEVYLNGENIGGTKYGYVGFEIDVTDKMKTGSDNVIAVLADTRQPENSRWYTGGGLFRSVRLVATDRSLYFGRHPLCITTRDNRYVNISGEFTNRTRKPARTNVKIYSPDGKLIYEEGKTINRHRMAKTVEVPLSDEIKIAEPQLWDLDSPKLYTAVAQLLREDGSVVDEVKSAFGIRTIEFGPDFGFKLNGKKVLLQGYANHHTLGALGAAAYPRAIEKRIQLMKQYGINHIRTSHNPYSREFIELCDKYGILLVDELYDKWTSQHTGGAVAFENLWQYDVPEWIKRDRNSPSVIMWSLGNELQQDPNQPFNDFGVTMYRLMRTLISRYDSTRLVTVAMHPRFRNWDTDSLPPNLALVTDVQSYNYRYMYFPGDSKRFPWMKFYQSEASVAAMGQNFFEMNLDKVIGLAYWGAIDYLGESQGWPAKGWGQGVFYIDLEPKPKAYYMKSFFKPDEPVVHIGIIDKKGDQMWNGVQTGNDGMSDHWNRIKGQKLSIVTYTNADEVELMLNGSSLGKKTNDKSNAKMRNQIRWENVEYAQGTLEAIARNSGKVVARHRIETTGEAARLVAEPDAMTWKADGQDLQHVKIVAVDKKGRRVNTAINKVNFAVEGEADIVGVINGDINSHELTVGSSRSLFNGTCTVILRSRKSAGKIQLTATADGLKQVKIQLKTI